MDSKEQSRTRISLPFQFILILISISILSGLIFWRSNSLISWEVKPTIHPITPKKVQELGGLSQAITVGFTIEEFIDFDMVTNSFILDGIIWFKFDPGAISLDSLSNFSFVKGTFIQKSTPDLRIIDDKILAQYTVRIKFKSDLNYNDFPLDSHRIFAVLINKSVSPSEIIFESSKRELNVQAKVESSGWKLYDTIAQTGYIEYALDPYDKRQDNSYPAVMFEFYYTRNSIRYALSIILPLALIFYLLLFSVSLKLISAVGISAASVTTVLAYRFVIENLSPKTGSFMISDYIFFLFLAATIGTFLINVIEMTGYYFLPKTKMILIGILHVLILISIIYVIVW